MRLRRWLPAARAGVDWTKVRVRRGAYFVTDAYGKLIEQIRRPEDCRHRFTIHGDFITRSVRNPGWGGQKSRLVVAARDGSGAHYVLPFDYANSSDADISPDGRWIAFRSDLDGDDEIYVARIDGSDRRQLTHNHGTDRGPRWLADSRRVVFAGRGPHPTPEKHFLIPCIAWRDGSGFRKLSDDACERVVPSPDGRLVAYVQSWPAEIAHVCVVPVSGGEPRRITPHTDDRMVPEIVAWTPDVRWIVYDVAYGFIGHWQWENRYVISADGKRGPYFVTEAPDSRLPEGDLG